MLWWEYYCEFARFSCLQNCWILMSPKQNVSFSIDIFWVFPGLVHAPCDRGGAREIER